MAILPALIFVAPIVACIVAPRYQDPTSKGEPVTKTEQIVSAARERLEKAVEELRYLRGMELFLAAEITEARAALEGALAAADLIPSGGPPFRISFGLRTAIQEATASWWCLPELRERLCRAELGPYYRESA